MSSLSRMDGNPHLEFRGGNDFISKPIPSTSFDSNPADRAPNLTIENRQISQTVKNWMNGKCANDEQWQYFKDKFSQVTFETKLNVRSELYCIMTCYCKSNYQMTKSAQKVNYSERWVYCNIHRHFNKLLNSYLQSKGESEHGEKVLDKNSETENIFSSTISSDGSLVENNGAIKKQQGLLKFFTVLGKNSGPSSNVQSSTQSSDRLSHTE